MSTFRIEYPVSGEGEQVLGNIFGELDQVRVFFNLVTAPEPAYENYRHYSPRSFFGKMQFFDGEAVALDMDLSFASQRLFSRDSCCVAAMEDRCRKYVCLSQKIDWVGKAFQLQFPNSIVLLGNYPLSSDAANYGEVLYRDSFTSFAWVMEPGATGVITISGDAPSATPCSPLAGQLPAPNGCRAIGERPPNTGTCTPSVPPSGGGSGPEIYN